jgi:hypothetical protein
VLERIPMKFVADAWRLALTEVTAPRLIDWLNRIRNRPAGRTALGSGRTGKPEHAFAPGPEHSRWG